MKTSEAEGFAFAWTYPEDAHVPWELSAWTPPRPVPMLERDILERFGQALKRCHDETGGGFRHVAVRFLNGFCYMGRSADSEEVVAARRGQFRQHAREFESRGTDIWTAEVRPLVELRLARLRQDRRRARGLSSMVTRLEAAMDAALASARGPR